MFTIGSPKTSVKSGSVKSSAGMTIIYQVCPIQLYLQGVLILKNFVSEIFAPRPMLPATKPQTAYIKRKAPVQQKQKITGAARITEEERFVKGLGYVRADAIPCRSKAAKRASAGSVADLERVCAAMMSYDVTYGEAGSAESSSSPRPGLYEVPRFPSTFSS
ncbi:hypothetical protein FRC06_002353 [Ceratobasidium sp. 370]|nr:hypothetical protein FRC06_002353 [Ceratobasidium sp. 370]